MEIKSGLKSLGDKEKWAARRASFAAKAKATKVVWFPPDPAKSGTKAASTATGATKKTVKKTTGAAKKATKKTSGAAKKATSGAKK